MLLKTHLAISVFTVLLLLDHVTYKFPFIAIAIFASFIPDVDSGFSTLGKRALFRPVQWLTRHRGIIHSFTFCLVVSFLLAMYFPIAALPFFLGYGLHLLLDAFSVEGIRPFWPLTYESRGPLRVGSSVEEMLFVAFCVVNVVLIVRMFI